MADLRMLFTCLYSSVPRQGNIRKSIIYAWQRLFASSSLQGKENEEKTCVSMFEFYRENPTYLKKRKVRKLKFDIERERDVENKKEDKEPPVIDPEKAEWTEGCKRVGAIGVKLGMMPLWLKNGKRVPVTLVQVTTYRSVVFKILALMVIHLLVSVEL